MSLNFSKVGDKWVSAHTPLLLLLLPLIGKKFVKTNAEAKDRKKHDPTCQVKSRNEPCNLRQVSEPLAVHYSQRG